MNMMTEHFQLISQWPLVECILYAEFSTEFKDTVQAEMSDSSFLEFNLQ